MGGQASAHNPAHTAAGTAQTHTQSHVSSSVKKKPEPIPTPKIHMVPTYAKDYRPDFKQPQVLSHKGGRDSPGSCAALPELDAELEASVSDRVQPACRRT